MGLFCRGVSRPPFHKIFFFFFFRLFVSCFLLRPKTVFTVRNIFCAKKTRHFVFLVGKYFFSPFNALHIHKIRDQGIYQLATECLNQKWNCRPPQFLYVTTKGRVEPRAFRSTHRFHKLNPWFLPKTFEYSSQKTPHLYRYEYFLHLFDPIRVFVHVHSSGRGEIFPLWVPHHAQ